MLSHLLLLLLLTVWFEIAFPLFLKEIIGWSDASVSGAMGIYILVYGSLQSYSSRLCLRPFGCQPPKSKHVAPWTFLLAMFLFIFGCLYLSIHGVGVSSSSSTLLTNIQSDNNLWWTLSVFTIIISIIAAVVMAVLSSIHSYLIVLYAGRNKVAKVKQYFFFFFRFLIWFGKKKYTLKQMNTPTF